MIKWTQGFFILIWRYAEDLVKHYDEAVRVKLLLCKKLRHRSLVGFEIRSATSCCINKACN